jgi:methionyl aminopeptidase
VIVIKREDELRGMRDACKVTAKIRDAIVQCVAAGVSTQSLSDYAGELIRGLGAESAFLNYRGYPGEVCISVNDEVVHGIPGRRRIEDGDLVSVDVGVKYGGFIGDCAVTVMVGEVGEEKRRLVRVTQQALESGIDGARAGSRVSDISYAVEQCVKRAGFSVVRDFVGHGVGRDLHEEPQIPNFGRAGKGPRLRAGMTLAIEPMVNMGSYEVEVQADGWTVLTKDRKPSAHFEHTILVREEGPEILTL